jgi:alpha-galactosidase
MEKKLPYDYYWIDAGWYGKSETDSLNVFNGDWGTVGDWIVNKHRHPETLKPISEAIQKANMKFLLWFEPIRTTRGTDATKAHPEWFVDTGNGNLLLDLGKAEAKKYITETISGLITENGIDCYREDFNFDPFPYWTHKEDPDRAGMREMRFVEGVYSYWDELLRRHPNLVIDNCASGGRRIELETMKRSMPFWRTDYNCFPYLMTEATQAHTFGIAHWLPANSISPFLTKPDTYQARSALSSGVIYSLDECGNHPLPNEEEWDWWRTRITEAQRAKPFFYGDFYPLTVGNYSLENWLAYHFYLPEQKSGLIIAFRRPKSDVAAMTFDLTTVDPKAKYEFEDADTGETKTLSGEEIRKNGYTLKTNAPRESRLIYYRQIQ